MRQQRGWRSGMKTRTAPDGREYVQCCATVPVKGSRGDYRQCRRAAEKGDRLCGTHAAQRKRINAPRYVVTFSVRGAQPNVSARGFRRWPKFVIGRVFNSREDADLWCRLNASLIFAVRPDAKSYCVERFVDVWRSSSYEKQKNGPE